MKRALLIGCGQIGAGYDLDSDTVLTHAKAFQRNPRLTWCAFDHNIERAREISNRYSIPLMQQWDESLVSQYDIVSICVNTGYHLDYLSRLRGLGIPLVVCEKPVVSSLAEANELQRIGPQGNILVNYFRRFLPGFLTLKQRLTDFLKGDCLLGASITYNRGFLNNCSHALDLLEFLLEQPIDISKLVEVHRVCDFSQEDPTITGCFVSSGIPISVLALPGTFYRSFSLSLWLKHWRITVADSGDRILYECGRGHGGALEEDFDLRQVEVLKDYMIPVVDYALKFLDDPSTPLNFGQALELNRKMLSAVSKKEEI